MNNFFQYIWNSISQSALASLIKDAMSYEILSAPVEEWIVCIFQWILYIIPIWLTISYFGSGYLFITIPYLIVGSFIAMFNDNGPYWLSYFMLYFWLPFFIISGLFGNLICGILRKLKLMKPKYTQEEIEASNYLYQVGKDLIEKNKSKQ